MKLPELLKKYKTCIICLLVIIIVLIYLYLVNSNKSNIFEGFMLSGDNEVDLPKYIEGESQYRVLLNTTRHYLNWNNYSKTMKEGQRKFSIMSPKLEKDEKMIGMTKHNTFRNSIDIKSLILSKEIDKSLAKPNGYNLVFQTGQKFNGEVQINIKSYPAKINKQQIVNRQKYEVNENFNTILNAGELDKLNDTLRKMEIKKKEMKNDLDVLLGMRRATYSYTDFYNSKNAKVKLYTTSDTNIVLKVEKLFREFRISDSYQEKIPMLTESMSVPFGVQLICRLNSEDGSEVMFYIPLKLNSKTMDGVRSATAENIHKMFNSTVKYDSNSELSYWHVNDLSKGGREFGNIKKKIYSIKLVIPEETKDHIKNIYANEFFVENGKTLTYIEGELKKLEETLDRLKSIKETFENDGPVSFLKCYRFTTQKHHIAIGDIFVTDEKDLINYQNIYACVPDHCYRKVRDWKPSDIVYQGSNFDIYYNPYTKTLHGDKNGYVGRLVACPYKNFASEILIDNDKAIRKACTAFKKVEIENPIIPDSYNRLENEVLESKIYDHAKKIEVLKQYAIDLNKQNAEVVIINQEHNRIKLQEHLNKQHNRINKGVNKLMKDASQLAINIKYPVEILKNIINIIASSDNIPHQKKLDTINKLKKLEENANQEVNGEEVQDAIKDCPIFDLSEYVRRDAAGNIPCFGCLV